MSLYRLCQLLENFDPDFPEYCLKFVKFGHLILRKIIEIVPTRYQIFRLKCTKFHVSWASPYISHYRSLQRSSRPPIAGFKGPTSKRGRRREGKLRGRERMERNGRERRRSREVERGRDGLYSSKNSKNML